MEQEHNLILMLVVLLLVLASFRDFVAKFLQLTPPLLIKQESYSAVYPSGPSQGLKIRGGARSNVVGIMCPPVEIGLTDLTKMGGGRLQQPWL